MGAIVFLFCALTILFGTFYIREKLGSGQETYEHGWATDLSDL